MIFERLIAFVLGLFVLLCFVALFGGAVAAVEAEMRNPTPFMETGR